MVNAESGMQKLAKIARFSARTARIRASKNTLNYCVFTITGAPSRSYPIELHRISLFTLS
jgi:hypothetical protein